MGCQAHNAGAIHKKRNRDQAIETLRIVAAYGIVAYHAGARFHDFAYSGLIIFLILSPMVDTQFNWERVRTIHTLGRTLLLPWTFWLFVYAIVNLLLHRPILSTEEPVTGILYGTSEHLWFLPFMFAVLVALNMLKPRVRPSVMFWLCAAAATALLTTVSLWRSASLAWTPPFPQWLHAAVAVSAGVTLGLAGRVRNGMLIATLILAPALAVAVLALLPGIGTPYSVGIVTTALIGWFGARWLPACWSVQSVAECTMGVYLCHVIGLKIFGVITGHGSYLTVTLAFAAGLSTVWIARRFIPASKLVLG